MSGHLDAVDPGHLDVEQYNGGLKLLDRSLAASLGLSNVAGVTKPLIGNALKEILRDRRIAVTGVAGFPLFSIFSEFEFFRLLAGAGLYALPMGMGCA